MVVKNYDVNGKLFDSKSQVLEVKYIYVIIKKYINKAI